MNWRLRLSSQWHDLKSSLWFRPAAAAVLALLLAIAITTVDQLPYFTAPVLLRIGVDSARAVLAAIAGAMLSVVGMIFSILMVVLVLASQQFSPRILRNFAQDRTSQDVLSLFIGTFTYSLLVLARISEHEDRVFTPVLSITLAIVLALIAIGAFIHFIDHITRTIRISYILADISRQTEAMLRRLYANGAKEYSSKDHDEGEDNEPSWQAAKATIVRARRAGNVQTVDAHALLNIAKEQGISIKVLRSVGDFVAHNGALLVLTPGEAISQDLLDDLHSTFDISTERTMFDDVLFGIRQLADIALRALSAAINDPTTAVSAIDYLTNILLQAARHADALDRYRDEQGRVRLIVPRPTFAMMLDLAFSQIRHYSSHEVTITLRVLDALAEIAQVTTDRTRHAAIWQHAAMISRSVARNIHEPVDRHQINLRLQEIAARCGGDLEGVQLDNAEDPTKMVRFDDDEDEEGIELEGQEANADLQME